MIPLIYFSPSALVAANQKQPTPPINQRSTQTSHLQLYAFGLLMSAALHSMGLLLPSTKPLIEPVDTPPKPIMVSLSKPALTPPKTTPTFVTKVKPPKRPKPKALPNKITKASNTPKPIITTTGASKRSVTAPTHEAVSKAPPEPVVTQQTATPITQTHAPVAKAEPPKAAEPLVLPNLNANYLHNPPPDYPDHSQQMGEEGKVLLRVFVNAEGRAEQVTLRKSSGHDRLDHAAQNTVQHWRFVPARRGNEAVAAWVVVPISFNLEG